MPIFDLSDDEYVPPTTGDTIIKDEDDNWIHLECYG